MDDEDEPTYAELLRGAMAATSRRKFSGAFAEMTGNKVESEFRALGKYLSGGEEPSRERAAMLAVLLGDYRLALVREGVSPRRTDRLELVLGRLESIETFQGRALQRIAEGFDGLGRAIDDVSARLSLLEPPSQNRRNG